MSLDTPTGQGELELIQNPNDIAKREAKKTEEINQRNAENRKRNLEWARKEGYEVDSNGHVYDPQTKDQVILLTRKNKYGEDLVDKAPSVHPFPKGNVPDTSIIGDINIRGAY